MIKWAGRIIVLCGVGHLLGALWMTAPRYAAGWFGGALWQERASNQAHLVEMSHSTAAFWFTVYCFSVPLILVGLTVLWLQRRGITPPTFIAWVVAAWTLVGEILSGPSPLMLLLLAAGLLLVGSRRATHQDNPVPHAVTEPLR